MIREFQAEDINKIEINEYSGGIYLEQLKPLLKFYEGYVFEDEIIKAILFFRKYAEDNYEGFLVCAKKINALDGRTIKNLIYTLKDRLKMKRIETLSLDCPVLNRWHKFIGFECEGIRRKFLDNKDYKMWGIIC